MKTMKDYLDLYLSCDVLSLADGLKKLRNKIRNSTLENIGMLMLESLFDCTSFKLECNA